MPTVFSAKLVAGVVYAVPDATAHLTVRPGHVVHHTEQHAHSVFGHGIAVAFRGTVQADPVIGAPSPIDVFHASAAARYELQFRRMGQCCGVQHFAAHHQAFGIVQLG